MFIYKKISNSELTPKELIAKIRAFVLTLKYDDFIASQSIKVKDQRDYFVWHGATSSRRSLSLYCFTLNKNNSLFIKYSNEPFLSFMILVQFVICSIGFILGVFNLSNIRFINENFWIFGVFMMLDVIVYLQLRSRANHFHAKLQRFLSATDQSNNV
jgi:hypothetical protein